MATRSKTVAGAAQFSGLTPSTGLFSFSMYDRLPATSRVTLPRVSYHAIPGGNGGTRVDFYFRDPADPTNGLILLGRGLAPTITGPDSSADFVVCGGLVPRNSDGRNWELVVTSAGKTVDATVVVDEMPQPFPHSNQRDSVL